MVVIKFIQFPVTFNSGAVFCDHFLSGYEIWYFTYFLTHSCYDWDPNEGQEELEEVQAELKKKEAEVGLNSVEIP